MLMMEIVQQRLHARDDYVFIPAKEHDFSGEWKSDQTGHWKTCKKMMVAQK